MSNDFNKKPLLKYSEKTKDFECQECGFISDIGGTCVHCDLKEYDKEDKIKKNENRNKRA